MKIYDIIGCAISAIVLLGLAAVFGMYLFWKRCRKWVALLPSKKGHKIGFSIAHLIVFGLVVALVGTGVFLSSDSNESDTENPNGSIVGDIKNEANILNGKAIDAEKKLSDLPAMPTDDSINKMLSYSEIQKDLKTGTTDVFPPDVVFYSLSTSIGLLGKERDNKKSCSQITSLPTKMRDDFENFLNKFNSLRMYKNQFLYAFETNMRDDNENRKKEFETEMNSMNSHAETIKTRLTKDWKTSVVQMGNAVDRKKNKVADQDVSNLLATIGLWFIPLIVIFIFVCFSIATHWTKEKSRTNRCLFIFNHIMFYLIALLICACAGYYFYQAIVAKNENESSTPEEHPKFFDFQIPTTNNAAKSSYKILSTSSGKLFDSPNDDVLIGQSKFFDNWEQHLLNDLKNVMDEEETKYHYMNYGVVISEYWQNIKSLNQTLHNIKSDTACNSSLPAITQFLNAFEQVSGPVEENMRVFESNLAEWKIMEEKLERNVKQRVQEVKASVEKRRQHINDGINVLNIDCKSTMTTLNKINHIKTAEKKGDKDGIVGLISCFILLNLFICVVLFLYTYRKFGPSFEHIMIREDGRLGWIKGVLNSTCLAIYKNFNYSLSRMNVNEEVMKIEEMKPFKSTVRHPKIACVKGTRVFLKNLDASKYFVHANYITMPNAELQTDGTKKKKYIAVSGPVKKGIDLFLHMLYHENVNVVLMLCNFIEDNEEKCAKYFPEKLQETMKFGDYSIKLVQIKSCAFKEIVWRVLELSSGKDGIAKKKTINHLHYTKWPDHSIPENPQSVLAYMDMANKLTNDAPIVVHCSAGIGRTGTLIAIDYCSESLKDFADVSLSENIRQLRQMRYGSVYKPIQFVFLFAALLQLFNNEKLVSDEKVKPFFSDYEQFRRNPPMETEDEKKKEKDLIQGFGKI